MGSPIARSKRRRARQGRGPRPNRRLTRTNLSRHSSDAGAASRVSTIEALDCRLAAGDLDQLFGDIDADHREAAAAQLERVPARAAGEVEDPLVVARLEDLQGAVDFAPKPANASAKLGGRRSGPSGSHCFCRGR